MAISNLIDNAIKFTNKGFIKVILKEEPGDEIILEVIDTGIGIDKKYLDNMFEPYRQEQMGYGRAYEGIGLGLSIVKKVLNLNNAAINVESKKGKGTIFSIHFGKGEQSDKSIVKTETKIIIPVTKEITGIKMVLIVEDDLMNQVTIKKFIDRNYKTLLANSSDEAYKILNTNKVDIILMDISIKGDKNGLELTRELKKSIEFSDIPVIAITAHAFKDDEQNALSAGCDGYLSKPFTKASLLNMIALYH
jgi:CheY-like chemotaxis protein